MQFQTQRAFIHASGEMDSHHAVNYQSGGSDENLLNLLKVQVEALTFNEIGEGYALIVPPADEIVVHFVLAGSGSIKWDGGCLPLERGTIAVIPRSFAKRLTGPGIVRSVAESRGAQGAHDGYQKFAVHDALSTDLRLASASISATLAQGAGLFDYLQQPLIEHSSRRSAAMFECIFEEISRPWLGSKSVIEAAMKQILLLVLRGVLKNGESHSPICLTMTDHTLASVVNQIISNPGQRHSLRAMAQQAGILPAELVRKFEAAFGQTPVEFIQLARIDAAKIMLENTRSPIKCIAGVVGFASRSHFSREFTRITGQDPTTFRNLKRNKA